MLLYQSIVFEAKVLALSCFLVLVLIFTQLLIKKFAHNLVRANSSTYLSGAIQNCHHFYEPTQRTLGGVKGRCTLFENVLWCIAILKRGPKINIFKITLLVWRERVKIREYAVYFALDNVDNSERPPNSSYLM